MRKLKLSVPSSGTILGFIAVVISLGSAAYAAGALVTIGDPITTQKARVAAPGRLGVYVDTPVTTRSASPATTFHSFTAANPADCKVLATPPAGKALIIQQVRVNTYQNPTPGSGNAVWLYLGPACSGAPVGSVAPPAVGHNTITFGPGLTIPQGQTLRVWVGLNLLNEVYADGFTLPAAQVSASVELAAE